MDLNRCLKRIESRLSIPQLNVCEGQIVKSLVAVGMILEGVSEIPYRFLYLMETQAGDPPV
jgi:hypothetical protein